MLGRLRLHHRIVVPFVLLALLAISAAVQVSYVLVRRVLEHRVQSQVVSAAAVVSRSDFALNPAILRTVKDISHADVVTFGSDGTILATTVDGHPNRLTALVTQATASAAARESAGENPVVAQLDCDGVVCYAAYQRVDGRPGAVVAVIAGMTEAAAATRTISRAIVLAALVSFAAVAIVGQMVARRITAPLDRLVVFTQDVSSGATRSRAPEGADEVGRLAASFNQMLDQLERSQEALVRSEKLAIAGLLAARIAHDIRNPLSSMKMHAQLVRAELGADQDTKAALNAILDDIEQVESVIRDLLELARPGEPHLQRVALTAVVRDVLKQLQPQLTHRKIRVETSFDADADVTIDVSRFKRAVSNIVINASEAMATGGTIEVETHAMANSTIALDVCDDGAGIDPELLDRVFDPFVSTKRTGVGLGLVNAKAIVESHGGRIELSRLSPRGTRARIVLPVSHG
jgi:signal transduction histidine kinase